MEIMSPKTKTTTTYVPNDIIIDILSWVPANSLLRLRWACKYWFHLITRDTSFAKLHLHCSTTTTTTTIHHPHNLSVLISKPSGTFAYACKIFQYYIDNSTTTTGPSFSCGATNNPILSGIFVGFQILGSCHGLILFSYYLQQPNETILCIWNPCTKEYKYLSKPPYGFNGYPPYGFFEVSPNFGLGYDHSIHDYKVICNVQAQDGTSIHVQVYALRTNSWKYIGSFPTNYNIRFIGNGVFVNGALHFIYDEGAMYPGARRILSLDFEKEMYVEISNQPECLNDMTKSIWGTPLTMFEGSLCLTIRTIRNSIEAWVMNKDYNMNNHQEYSWSKLYEIPYIHSFESVDNLQPQRFTKDGEILLLARSKRGMEGQGLFLFDRKNNKITTHNVYKLHPIDQAATITTVDTNKIEVVYIESLVSLNSGTYIDEKGDYMHYWQEDTNSGTYIDAIGDHMDYFEDYLR